jgi:hypothetical protein
VDRCSTISDLVILDNNSKKKERKLKIEIKYIIAIIRSKKNHVVLLDITAYSMIEAIFAIKTSYRISNNKFFNILIRSFVFQIDQGK